MIPLHPGKIIGVGRNYLAHARELGNDVPSEPLIFLKPTTALLEPGGTIVLPRVSKQVEFEAEIGVVIGRRLRRAGLEEAERGIGGFTCVNDVTCRDIQRSEVQWTRAKGFDTFCPVGPRVASDLDWRGLELRCRVNGEQRQHARAADMHFPIPLLVSFISGIMTLEPGDLIATGTPAGTAPLAHGDVVEVEIPGIGVLSNPVRSENGT
jgi:2-keto-4-pentenoate hydratase/2-oxohepta-3-ene-1,7-dioic acid hydratase in catechol pathway